MPDVLFDHAANRQSQVGAVAALSYILKTYPARSLLDVGCGVGHWIEAALALGVRDVQGIDGVRPSNNSAWFRQVDLADVWDLERSFDVALCLEVAEHLPESMADHLVERLTCHAPTIFFSAACPGQPGQNHVNCQWPIYWQDKFNRYGYACEDALREQLWDDEMIEPWYRQNIFIARSKPNAGAERRLRALVHPELLPEMLKTQMPQCSTLHEHAAEIANGCMPISWYAVKPPQALLRKLLRKLRLT